MSFISYTYYIVMPVRSVAQSKHGTWKRYLLAAGLVFLIFNDGCRRRRSPSNFAIAGTDRQITGESTFPIAVDPSRVGTYPIETKSGAGYFYDDVLEYRVWFHPHDGALALNDTHDYFFAFAQYEQAKSLADRMPGAEPPLVLVRQREWIDEPKEGQFIPMKGERITEWRVAWLGRDKRHARSIEEFLKNPRPSKNDGSDEDQE